MLADVAQQPADHQNGGDKGHDKPNRDFYQRVLDSAGVGTMDALMVGDDIDSDVGGAQQMGISGCLVCTGKYRKAYADQSSVKPNYIIESIAQLTELLRWLNKNIKDLSW